MEYIYQKTYAERVALIDQLLNNGKWEIVATITSSSNTYRLFESKIEKGSTIGINDGVSNFYEDVIYSN